MKLSSCLLTVCLLLPGLASATAEKVDDYHWTGVERVVAIGDLHGDYEQYIKVMRSAGLLTKSGKWAGGKTHLVQTGDIPDRGPDTLKIIDHLVKLSRQAKKKGGHVHMLIGNHEAMNVTGDLRYVSAAEYAAFAGRNSARYQEMQWQRQVEWMQENMPDFAALDLQAYRKEWEQRVPLGWVEHRTAWALSGEYGSLVKNHPVAIQINDTIFVHGGISSEYCQFSLQSLTEQVITAMEHHDPAVISIAQDPLGPLWYRGLAWAAEADVFSQTLDNILTRYGARRLVVGHTPTGGVVWPRFDQRVIVNDTGIASYYGAHMGVLVLTATGASAIYGDREIPLPASNAGREDYLRAVIEADANNAELKARLAKMLAPEGEEPTESVDGVGADPLKAALPTAGEITPGTCQ